MKIIKLDSNSISIDFDSNDFKAIQHAISYFNDNKSLDGNEEVLLNQFYAQLEKMIGFIKGE